MPKTLTIHDETSSVETTSETVVQKFFDELPVP